MTAWIIKRAAWMLVTFVMSLVAIFAILNTVPGGPLDTLRMESANRSRRLTSLDYARLESLLGMDKPVHLRFLIWVLGDDWIENIPRWAVGTDNQGQPFKNGNSRGILRGDMGKSWSVAANRPVVDVIISQLGNTLILVSASFALAALVAVPIGVLAAVKVNTIFDHVAAMLSSLSVSMPVFWIGWMLIFLFSLKFRQWGLPSLPSGGIVSFRGDHVGSIGDRLEHLILPSAALSMVYVGIWSRILRNSMLETLNKEYIRTAIAKGLDTRIAIVRHALRNALIPLITVATPHLANLFSGAILVESVFGYPGMGTLYLNALRKSDWPVVMGYLFVLSLLVIVLNFCADLLYIRIDPRIELGK